MNLISLGWTETQEHTFSSFRAEGFKAARVVSEQRGIYDLYTESGFKKGVVTGKMQHEAQRRTDFPAVGDWVVLDADDASDSLVQIRAILPRMSKFSRKEAGFVTEEQIVASNVDTVFLVTGLDRNFNLRRIERTLLAAWESGAAPVIVLTKADLCDSVEEKIQEVKRVAAGIPVHAVSSVSKYGLNDLKRYLGEGQTIVLLGSSGVGKSSLINYLMGRPVQAVSAVSSHDHRGRHTTTYRQLLVLPEGGVIIDTPGMRELQLWDVNEGLDATFVDIANLTAQCRYRDCTHHSEPGCAVQRAIQTGNLSPNRFKNYEKMERELRRMEEKKKTQQRVRGKRKYSRSRKHMRDAD